MPEMRDGEILCGASRCGFAAGLSDVSVGSSVRVLADTIVVAVAC